LKISKFENLKRIFSNFQFFIFSTLLHGMQSGETRGSQDYQTKSLGDLYEVQEY